MLDNYDKRSEEEKNRVQDASYKRVRIAFTPQKRGATPMEVPREPATNPQEIRGSRYGDYHQASPLRMFTACQSMALSRSLAESPGESKVSVFRIFRMFVAKLMSLQKQLDIQYHTDAFLRDRLLTAVVIPAIQWALRDRLAREIYQTGN